MVAAMFPRLTDAPISLDAASLPDQPIVISGVDWDRYEALLAVRGERSHPKAAYLDGMVELMSTSREHERVKSTIGCLIEAYCLESDLDFSTYGNWTLKRKTKCAGVEADECYIFGRDPTAQDWPELAIEVVHTHGGLNKLEIYRRLEVGEVWFWELDAISVYVLDSDGYRSAARSVCLPELDLELVCRLALVEPTSEAVRRLRAVLRG
jgi:Uma2 family endonuclease